MKDNEPINTVLFVTSLVLGVFGFFGLVFWLIKRVLDGKGADLYQSHWGISYSAIGVLILLVATIFAALIGGYLNHQFKKEEKDFLDKYGKK